MQSPEKNKRSSVIISFLSLLILVAALIWFITSRNTNPATTEIAPLLAVNTNVQVTLTAPASPSSSGGPLVGEKILRDYAKSSLPPENDLTLLSHLMDSFTLLVKSAADGSLSANEDWSAALRGNNLPHERFLPTNHVIFNSQGQLTDRWGTPVFFHALGAHRFELRSAGPDKQMWTADDVHRNYDGSFRRGTNLNPVSLLEAATKPAR